MLLLHKEYGFGPVTCNIFYLLVRKTMRYITYIHIIHICIYIIWVYNFERWITIFVLSSFHFIVELFYFKCILCGEQWWSDLLIIHVVYGEIFKLWKFLAYSSVIYVPIPSYMPRNIFYIIMVGDGRLIEAMVFYSLTGYCPKHIIHKQYD